MMTAPQLIWRAFGARVPEGKTGGKYKLEKIAGTCATCAAPIKEGVPFQPRRGVAGINNDTFSGYAEYARWGTHVCPACAWLFGDPKRMHRAVLVVGEHGWWPTIAQTIEGRPRWRHALREIALAHPDTPMTGILTTDPKPRLWPRANIATCGSPGLYLHIPEQDISTWRALNLQRIAVCLAAIDLAMAAGATKTAALHGLLASPKLVDKLGLGKVIAIEDRLAPLRASIEFGVGIVIA